MAVRRPTHSGSWYSGSETELSAHIDSLLSQDTVIHGPARAIIAPHAGYKYSGLCAASAYRQIDPSVVRRVFILGPSHHARLMGCALSKAVRYRTPLYDIAIDSLVYSQLNNTKLFEWMNMSTDENEHSIEMQLPFIARVMNNYRDFKIVPILVGTLTPASEENYSRMLANYLADPENLFVISSDFCHWGRRFQYTFYDQTCGPIYQSIEALDRTGMDLIERNACSHFKEYLKRTGNTICGRHPIAILLQAIAKLQKIDPSIKANLKFLNYHQSSKCRNQNDSSVSYAAASLLLE